ncbi:cytochrome d ubiquinol oxidase subunit II [Entomohabitans teleogrylli]|uniref:cytochrome d ubiquinol oxidase subunit II n=1 Tax=Entomohabitans teleogrylli TaxID=1384589 RepID=UPI00073D82EF|nr:cytochrome d ubiquinol oxidase subunit II [Entomohabitans teleogrylli]
MAIDLSLIWFAIIIFAILMYIVMDGFDLGVGILFPLVPDAAGRDVMVNSVAPVWDGNETWLVLGGAALFGAFPLAYAVIIDALAIPLTLMLIGLIFRGVAFEFRFKAPAAHRRFWDGAFLGGSLMATFCQGVVAGAVVNGIAVSDRHYAGGPFDWLNAFTLFCGFGLVVAYGLLGATWLIAKAEDPLARQMRRLTRGLLPVLLLTFLVISLWTPLAQPAVARRWFSLPGFWFLLPVPLMVAAFSLLLWRRATDSQVNIQPFLLALGLIFLGFAGLGISIWPHLIPPHVTLWQAAAPAASQRFMLVGALIIIPVILGYTAWSYWVFRGKVPSGEGYH